MTEKRLKIAEFMSEIDSFLDKHKQKQKKQWEFDFDDDKPLSNEGNHSK